MNNSNNGDEKAKTREELLAPVNGSSRVELIMRVTELQEELQGICKRCGRPCLEDCQNGIRNVRWGTFVVCSNAKDL